MNRRSAGYTLIEVIATIALTSSLLALLAGWLTVSLRNQRLAAEHLERVNAQDRLARQFRQDVRAARRVLALETPLVPQQRLRLDLGEGRSVAYLARTRVLERIESASSGTLHHDQYAVSPQVRVEVDEQPPSRRVSLLIPQHPSTTSADSAELCIEAVLGSDRRFEKGGEHE
jgi:prepilin-type N-terminal cleavage/methylation domain-containing protein